MRSLYLKIFLWFWIAVVCLIGVSFVITYTLRRESFIEPFRISPTQYAIDAQMAAFTYEQHGRKELNAYLGHLAQSSSMRSYVFNSHGMQVGGGSPNDTIKRLDRNARRQQYDTGPIFGRLYRVQPAKGPSGQWYTLISEAQTDTAPGETTILVRLAAVAITATLVCLVLTRHITAPIAALRRATREIARGRFSARVGDRIGRRGDELGSLGRDFDKMAEQLETLLASQQRLLADISHELRSPLARLNVALEIARRDGLEGAPTAFDRIDRESHRLNELIAELTTITRLESGVAAAQARPVDIVELVRDIVTDADFEARSRDGRSVALTVSPGMAAPAIVSGEPELLRRAVENVIRNAVTYTAESTAVDVTLSTERVKSGSVCHIAVRDRGPGVPAASLTDIFNPFYRLDAARDRRSGGVGLGLAIVERAVSLHGGAVAASNHPGGGLEIVITLALSAAEKN